MIPVAYVYQSDPQTENNAVSVTSRRISCGGQVGKHLDEFSPLAGDSVVVESGMLHPSNYASSNHPCYQLYCCAYGAAQANCSVFS